MKTTMKVAKGETEGIAHNVFAPVVISYKDGGIAKTLTVNSVDVELKVQESGSFVKIKKDGKVVVSTNRMEISNLFDASEIYE